MAFKNQTAGRAPFLISTERGLLDVDAIHGYLATCYWSPGIARSRVERAMANSLCFGVYDTSRARAASGSRGGGAGSFLDSVDMSEPLPALVGFARVVTDGATYAYLCDVFVLEQWRGRGLSKWLMETVLGHPDLQGLRRFCLMTRDAHGLYARYGFAAMPEPGRYMEIVDRESYKRG